MTISEELEMIFVAGINPQHEIFFYEKVQWFVDITDTFQPSGPVCYSAGRYIDEPR